MIMPSYSTSSLQRPHRKRDGIQWGLVQQWGLILLHHGAWWQKVITCLTQQISVKKDTVTL